MNDRPKKVYRSTKAYMNGDVKYNGGNNGAEETQRNSEGKRRAIEPSVGQYDRGGEETGETGSSRSNSSAVGGDSQGRPGFLRIKNAVDGTIKTSVDNTVAFNSKEDAKSAFEGAVKDLGYEEVYSNKGKREAVDMNDRPKKVYRSTQKQTLI